MIRPIDTVVTALPFLVVLVIELVPLAFNLCSDTDEDSRKSTSVGAALSVEEQLEQSIGETETKGYELLRPKELDRVVEGTLRSELNLTDEEFDTVFDELTMSVQRQVPIDEEMMGTLVREHVAYVNDRIQLIVAGLATVVSFLAVLYSRTGLSPVSIVDISLYMAGPVVLLFLVLGIFLNWKVDSPFDYKALREYLGVSPVSIALILANVAVCLGIFILDALIIGYQ